jgi:hypothetical protein
MVPSRALIYRASVSCIFVDTYITVKNVDRKVCSTLFLSLAVNTPAHLSDTVGKTRRHGLCSVSVLKALPEWE